MKKALISILLCLTVIFSLIALGSCNSECAHEYGEWNEETAASCTQEGVKGHYTCSLCEKKFDASYKEISDLHIGTVEHNYVLQSDGSYVCSLCEDNLPPAPPKDPEPAPTPEPECLHENTTRYEVVAHTQENDGTYLVVCDDCGLSEELKGKFHDDKGDSVIIKPAGCTEKGVYKPACSVCGFMGEECEFDALGHTYSDAKLVIDPEKNLCVNGAMEISTCEICGDKKLETVASQENVGIDGFHTVNEWEMELAPSYISEGKLIGKCAICECAVEYILPEVNDEDESYEIEIIEERESCNDTTGLAECTFTADNAANQSFEFTVSLLPINHKLSGVEIDINEKYDVDTDGIIENANAPVNCYDNSATASFICSKCNQSVAINVYRNHTVEEWSVIQHADCENDGTEIAICTVDGCGAAIERTIPALGHTYVYDNYTFEYENGDITIIVNGECYCTAKSTLTYSAEDEAVAYERVDATCTQAGTDTYTITLPDSTSLSAVINIPKLNHLVGDKRLPAAEEICYVDEYSALAEYVSFDSIRCGEVSEINVNCHECSELITVKASKRHSFDGEWDVIVEATCTTEGEKITRCTDENCAISGGYEIREVIEALGHEYEYYMMTAQFDESDTSYEGDRIYNLSGRCKRDCCAHTTVSVVVNPEIEITASTCIEAGSKEYVCDMGNGLIVRYIVELPLSNHCLGGKEMNNASGVPYILEENEGIEEFTNSPIVCDDVVRACFVCDVCEETVEILAKKNHTVDSWTVNAAPTCTSTGEQTGVCVDCGINVTEELEAVECKFDGWANQLIDLNEMPVSITANCEFGCGAEHVLTDICVTVISVPTCTSTGVTVYTAVDENGIGWSFAAVTEKVSHSVSGLVIDAAGAYPLTEGKVMLFADEAIDCHTHADGYYVCDSCGGKVPTTVYQPHVFVNPEITVAPTCTTGGVVSSKCQLCDEYDTEDTLPLGHNYSFSVSKEPTATEAGEISGVCTVCGANCETVTLPILTTADVYTVTNESVAECEKDGIDSYMYVFVVDGVERVIYFDVVVAALGHIQGDNGEYEFTNEENVTFVDENGEEITAKVLVTYTVYECDTDGCDKYIVTSKSFDWGEQVTYEFDMTNNVWVKVIITDASIA